MVSVNSTACGHQMQYLGMDDGVSLWYCPIEDEIFLQNEDCGSGG